jgi:hypothetical protein
MIVFSDNASVNKEVLTFEVNTVIVAVGRGTLSDHAITPLPRSVLHARDSNVGSPVRYI